MKDIKISDCLDNIDPAEINNIEMSDGMKDKFSVERMISVKKIKKIVFDEISVNTDSVNINKKRKKISGRKLAVIISAAVLIISTSVYGMNYFGTLEKYFPGIVQMMKDDVQDVSAKVEKNGVVLTVEAAVNDGIEAIISYNLTMKDGSAFDERIDASIIKLDGLTQADYTDRLDLTDDNKKLEGYINPKLNIENGKSINDYNLTLSVTDLITRQHAEEVSKLNLNQIINGVKNQPVELIPDIAQGFVVEKAEVYNGKVKIECGYTYETVRGSGDTPARIRKLSAAPHIIGLKNMKTGEIINPDESKEFNKLSFSINEGTDLSGLNPIISYNKENVVVAGTWEVPIKLKAADVISKDINKTYILADKKMILKKVTVTPLGVYLNGAFVNYDDTELPIGLSAKAYLEDALGRVYLVYNNGQILHLTGSYGETNKSEYGNMEAKFTYSNLEIGEEISDGNRTVKDRRIFIDIDEISSIIVKDIAIPLR